MRDTTTDELDNVIKLVVVVPRELGGFKARNGAF